MHCLVEVKARGKKFGEEKILILKHFSLFENKRKLKRNNN